MGRRWWEVPQEKAEQIRRYLLERAEPEPARLGPTEQWRVRSSGVTVQYWDNGTLYCVGSASKESEAKNAWALIESVAGPPFVPTERPVMLGLDETGKGELAGPMTLAVAWVPEALAKQVERIVGLARTKEHRPPAYWERLFVAMTPLTEQGVDFQIEQIPPWKVDRYDPYDLLDATYQRLLSGFIRRTDPARCRVVVDDYGVGPTFDRFLQGLRSRGAEVVVQPAADDHYIEARVASVLAKWERESVMQAINTDPEFCIAGLSVGSGMGGNPQTLAWLRAWKASGRPWPSFVRRSYRTVWEMDGGSPPSKL